MLRTIALAALIFLSADANAQTVASFTSWETSFVLFPADTNAAGTGFGGKLLAEMDRCAGITTRRFLYDSPVSPKAVTVGVDKVSFWKPADVGDLLIVRGQVIEAEGKTAVIRVTVDRETLVNGRPDRQLIVSGRFTFCAVKDRKSVEHGLTINK